MVRFFRIIGGIQQQFINPEVATICTGIAASMALLIDSSSKKIFLEVLKNNNKDSTTKEVL